MEAQVRDRVLDWLAYCAEADPDRIAAVELASDRWLTCGAPGAELRRQPGTARDT